MELGDLQRDWEAFGEIDPLWAILTDPSKKNNRWDLREFFATGEVEIDWFMDSLAALCVSPKKETALDFGCGVGRLTQALCRHFQLCDGVDIANSMIRLARTYNRYGDRCRYHVSRAGDLRMFEDNRFDLIYSNLVLQHIPPPYSTRYIRDFVRVLTPTGVAIFQVPTRAVGAPVGPAADAMLRAKIVVCPSTFTAIVGAEIQLAVTVRNTSPLVWPARSAAPTPYKFSLGNHWLTSSGEMKTLDDGRTELLDDLKPADEVTLPLTVTAPAEPDTYILEVDMVRENVAWFKDKGSPTCCVTVRVTTDSAVSGPVQAPHPPTATAPKPLVMGMYYLPRPTVDEVITAEGARLLHVEECVPTGADFVSCTYYVTK